MGYNNREVEVKLLVEKVSSLKKVDSKLKKFFSGQSESIVRGVSKDVYWNTPGCKADFIRLRYYPDGLAQITVKHTDKGDNLDRVEIDLEVDDPDKATLVLSTLQGRPIGEIKKEYIVYFLDNKDTTISLYQIVNDDRVFIEVEARNKKRVFELIENVNKALSSYKTTRVNKSLYQMFLKTHPPKRAKTVKRLKK